MRRHHRALVAFHFTMVGAYVAIIGAWFAGWPRLSVAIWTAALVVLLLALIALLLLASVARGIFGTRLRRLRHQFQWRNVGGADGAAPGRITEKLDLEPPSLGVIARMGDQPGSQPGLGATDGESQRLDSDVDGPDGGPLLGECVDGE